MQSDAEKRVTLADGLEGWGMCGKARDRESAWAAYWDVTATEYAHQTHEQQLNQIVAPSSAA